MRPCSPLGIVLFHPLGSGRFKSGNSVIPGNVKETMKAPCFACPHYAGIARDKARTEARCFPIRIMHKAKSGRVSPATVSQNVAQLLEGRSRVCKEKVLNAILLGIINVCIELAIAAEGLRGSHEKQSAFPKTPFSRSLPQIPMRALRRAEPAGEDFSTPPSNTRKLHGKRPSPHGRSGSSRNHYPSSVILSAMKAAAP